jgi:hypothetical protein
MAQTSNLYLQVRAEIDHGSWWRLDWLLYFYWNVKASRPKGLPLLRITM